MTSVKTQSSPGVGVVGWFHNTWESTRLDKAPTKCQKKNLCIMGQTPGNHSWIWYNSGINILFPFEGLNSPSGLDGLFEIRLKLCFPEPITLRTLNNQAPEGIKGLSSKGAGITSAVSSWRERIFSLTQDPENRLLQGSDVSQRAFQISRIKNSTKVKLKIIRFLGLCDSSLNQA